MKTIKSIQGIGTPQELAAAMTEKGLSVPAKLQNAISTAASLKGFRVLLAVLIAGLVSAGTYFSFKGAISVFGSTAPAYASIFFAVLDLVITWVIYKEMLTGAKKWGLLFFEIATFIWFALTLTGFFGIGSLQSAANQKLTAMYSEVRATSYNNANALYQSMQGAHDQAASIKRIEEGRNGPGVVSEKATMIAESELRSPDALPFPAKAPVFENLPEANAWLQGEKAKLDEYNEKLTSYCDGIKNTAAGLTSGLQQSKAGKLSGEQTANLDVMIKSLDGVAKFELTEPKIPAPKLTNADMKMEGVGAIIGWVVEGVVLLLLIVLAFSSSGKTDMEPLRKECSVAIIEEFLDKNQVAYDKEEMHELPYQPMVRVASLMETDAQFLSYVKMHTSFNEIVKFARAHSVLVSHLPGAKWKFSEITKKLNTEPAAAEYLADIVGVDKSKWDRVNAIIKDHNKAVQIATNSELLEKFTDIVESFERKFANKEPKVIERTLSQLVPDSVTPAYLEVLHLLSEKLSSKLLEQLSRSFVMSLSNGTANLLVKNVTVGNEDGFGRIVQAWGSEENAMASEMLENNIGTDPQFGRLLAITLNSVGVEGLRLLHGAYIAEHKAASNGVVAMKVTIKKDAVTTLSAAVQAQNPVQINTAINGAFESKPTV